MSYTICHMPHILYHLSYCIDRKRIYILPVKIYNIQHCTFNTSMRGKSIGKTSGRHITFFISNNPLCFNSIDCFSTILDIALLDKSSGYFFNIWVPIFCSFKVIQFFDRHFSNEILFKRLYPNPKVTFPS